MAKKSTKMFWTYIITIVFTLIVTTVICWFAYSSILGGENADEPKEDLPEVQLEPMTVLGDYTPDAKDSRTLLLILDAEKRESGSCFLTARFIPTEGKFVFLPLPSNTSVYSADGEDTLYNIFRNGGSKKAVEAVEACLGIKIDKYIKFNRESFSVIADIFGGVEYNVPFNLVYDNPDTGETTVIKEGRQFLDSTALRKVLTYPDYSSEEYRAKCLGLAVDDLVRSGTKNSSSFANNLDDYFVAVINADIDTDITAYDYDEVEKAMKYVIKSSEQISSFLLSTGVPDENGHYVLDKKFLDSLPEQFSIEAE